MTESDNLIQAERLGKETASFANRVDETKEYYLKKHTDSAFTACQRAEEGHERNKRDNITLTKLMGVKAYEIFLKYMR